MAPRGETLAFSHIFCDQGACANSSARCLVPGMSDGKTEMEGEGRQRLCQRERPMPTVTETTRCLVQGRSHGRTEMEGEGRQRLCQRERAMPTVTETTRCLVQGRSHGKLVLGVTWKPLQWSLQMFLQGSLDRCLERSPETSRERGSQDPPKSWGFWFFLVFLFFCFLHCVF